MYVCMCPLVGRASVSSNCASRACASPLHPPSPTLSLTRTKPWILLIVCVGRGKSGIIGLLQGRTSLCVGRGYNDLTALAKPMFVLAKLISNPTALAEYTGAEQQPPCVVPLIGRK